MNRHRSLLLSLLTLLTLAAGLIGAQAQAAPAPSLVGLETAVGRSTPLASALVGSRPLGSGITPRVAAHGYDRIAVATGVAAKGGAQALGPRFAPGKWLTHFEKHGAEFGYKNSMEYLKGARALVGRQGVQTHTRANGDRLFYDAATNEFAVMRPDGVLRTYFRPETGSAYWKGQTGG